MRDLKAALSSLAVLPRKNWAWPDVVHTASFPASSRWKIFFLSPILPAACTMSPVLENANAMIFTYKYIKIYINRGWSCYLRECSTSVLWPYRECLFIFPAASFELTVSHPRVFLLSMECFVKLCSALLQTRRFPFTIQVRKAND